MEQQKIRTMSHWTTSGMVAVCLSLIMVLPSLAQGTSSSSTAKKKPEFPPFSVVSKNYTKVISTADGKKSLYTIYVDKKRNQMLAELPSGFASQKYFIALTISSGERFAGLQFGELYVYWRKYNNRLALIAPNVAVRSTGDKGSKSSVKRLYTDQVILDVPILTKGPGGGPVIDMDALLVQQGVKFFGFQARLTNPRIASIKTAKAFPKNVELAFEVPLSGGKLQTLHYSISLIPDSTGYKPRLADQRVGYFTTTYNDLGKYTPNKTWVRYINRWHLQKADPKLKLSPAKEPIVFYLEHTTPVRYRRWVRQGVLYWNKAFEKVGITNAIEVRVQNAETGENMDKDPEDVNYNFIRWLNNDVSTAIGPSRVHPLTGQILDADIILTDGWIRHFATQYSEILPKIAMEGYSAETLAWLDRHPTWDPRIRLAAPAQRDSLLRQRAIRGPQPYGGHPFAATKTSLLGDDEYDGLAGRTSQVNGLCLASMGKAFDMAILRMHLDLLNAETAVAADSDDDKGKDKDDEKEDKKKEDEKKKKADEEGDVLDGMPERFIGPLLAELVAHEVGHTLGLRHNFKSSSIYKLSEINGEKIKGTKPLAGSVMDYLPVNMNTDKEAIQGDYSMVGVGPYDEWAIEYGYSFAKDLKPILARVSEPELLYATDEDTSGPDPFARRYDFASDPLVYAKSQTRLIKQYRDNLLDGFVKDGESWAKTRRGYETTLSMQMRSLSMMANWVGGAFVNRDKKGDKGDRPPVMVVPTKDQREALQYVIEHAFEDDAFGLSIELLNHLGLDKWWDAGGFSSVFQDTTWPVHDRIMGIQASTLTMLMNPTTLRRVYDNEFRIPEDEDALTLAELLDTIRDALWSELDKDPAEPATARKPFISSLRRNLQQEHLQRLIDLTMPDSGFSAALKPIRNLATAQLRDLHEKFETVLETRGEKLDPYTKAHLSEAALRVGKALDADYIYNTNDIGGFGGGGFFFFQPGEDRARDN